MTYSAGVCGDCVNRWWRDVSCSVDGWFSVHCSRPGSVCGGTLTARLCWGGLDVPHLIILHIQISDRAFILSPFFAFWTRQTFCIAWCVVVMTDVGLLLCLVPVLA